MREQNPRIAFWWAALALLVITLSVHAVIYPLNGSTPDSWQYFYYADTGEQTVLRTDRQFVFLYTNLIELIFPGNTPSRAFVQALLLAVNSMILFRLLTRFMPQHPRFAFFTVLMYVLYIPYNLDTSRTLFSAGAYIWIMFLVAAGTACFYEAITGKNHWLWAGFSALFSFMAIRAYEGTLLLVLSIPLWLIFLRLYWNRRAIMVGLIWLVGAGSATLYFLLVVRPNWSTGYVGTLAPQGPFNLAAFLANLLQFYQLSFPVERIFLPQSAFTVPALLIAASILAAWGLYWRKTSASPALTGIPALFLLLLIGLYYIAAGAAPWAYIGFEPGTFWYRMLYYGSFGQTLVVAAVAGLFVEIIHRIFAIRPALTLTAVVAFAGFMGAHWFYQAQQWGSSVSAETRYFHDSVAMFRDVTGLVPAVADHTLIVLFCDRDTPYRPHVWSEMTALAAPILYGNARIAHPEMLTFTADGVEMHSLALQETGLYRYDELIGIRCEGTQMHLADTLPADLVPAAGGAHEYNPYARIISGFLPADRTRLLSWGTLRTPDTLYQTAP